MDRISAPEQNRLLGRLADMLRMTEGQAAAPEFLPPQLNVMNLVRQLMLPSAETVEKMSYGDPLFRMPQQSRIPITADKGYLADIAGMIPFTAPAARPSAQAVRKLVREIQTVPPVGAISPEIAAKVIPQTKVVDEAGKPLVVYHGTPDAFESLIRGESYFSPDPEIAGIYTSPTASSIATFAKRGDAPAVYPSYLEIKKPFDTRNPKIRKEFMEEYYGKYGNMTPLSDSGLPDWTEARDLREWIEETGKNYDGLILDEGGIPMPDGTVRSRGISYVPFESSQIKSAISDPQMAGLLDQPAQSVVEATKFKMPSFARLQPETSEDIDKIYDFLEDKAKKAGYKIETGSSNVSGSRYLTIYEDLPNDDVRSIELRVSNHADRHPVSYADERISIDPSSVDLEEALYMLQDKGYNLFGK